MRVLLLFALLLAPALAHAQAAVSAVLDAPAQVGDVAVRRLQAATDAALKDVGALAVGASAPFKRGAPRSCADDCAQSLVRGLSAPAVVLLDVRPESRADKVSLDVSFWLEGTKLAARRVEGPADALDAPLRKALEALLPPWAKKGFGGLRLDVEPGAAVKVDGRVVTGKPGEVVTLPAGPHQVDVVFADGHAVLQRLEVPEGARKRLDVPDPTEALGSGARAGGMTPLRTASYGVFMAGAATLAGGLVAGALSRSTAAGMTPCRLDSRDCPTLDAALEKSRQAQAYADTGNVLLGVGAGLVTVGVGLFALDAVSP